MNNIKDVARGAFFLAALSFAFSCLLAPFVSENVFLICFAIVFVTLFGSLYWMQRRYNSKLEHFRKNLEIAKNNSDFCFDKEYLEHTVALYGNLVAVSQLHSKDNTGYFNLISYIRSRLWECPDDHYVDELRNWFNQGHIENGKYHEHLQYLINRTLKKGKIRPFVRTICVISYCLNYLRKSLSLPLNKDLANALFEIFRLYKENAGSIETSFDEFFKQGDLTLNLQIVMQEVTGIIFSSAEEFKVYFERNEYRYRSFYQKNQNDEDVYNQTTGEFSYDDDFKNHVMALYGNLVAISGKYKSNRTLFDFNAFALYKYLNNNAEKNNIDYFLNGLQENGKYKEHLDYIIRCTLKHGLNKPFEKTFCFITGLLWNHSNLLNPYRKELALAIFEILYQYKINIKPDSLGSLHNIYSTFFLKKNNFFSENLKSILKETIGKKCAREDTFSSVFGEYISKRSRYFNNEDYSKKESDTEHNSQNREHSYSSSRNSTIDDCAYKTLGCNPDDDLTIIRRKYHDLAKEFHPDKTRNLSEEERKLAERKLKQINAAYEELKRKLNH